MSSRRISYADAVAMLGASSSTVAGLDRAVGGALLLGGLTGVTSALNLFDARTAFVQAGQTALNGFNDRLRGIGRLDRARRLQAAHAVIVVTAFFEAIDAERLPFTLADIELSRHDQVRMAGGTAAGGGWVSDLLGADLPQPTAESPYESTVERIGHLYRDLSKRLLSYLHGLAIWDRLSATAKASASAVLGELPKRAVGRYGDLFRRLALEVPEFGWWVRHSSEQATRTELRRGLRSLEELLKAITSGQHPGRRRTALAAAYEADLAEPILRTAESPEHLVMPALGEIYVDPVFRVREARSGDWPSQEGWWAETPTQDDLAAFLARHLNTERATEVPLMVLGQPGAGKSALTRVVAARLPAADFLPVRVPLRDVPADIELQDQIEYALRTVTGEQLSWPELSGSAGDALPVVLLDGFDELLQATGVSQSDFLERLTAFQRREAVQQRPVAVIVTSRTAVADRARLPEGTLVVRLEPFTEEHVDQWLSVWNRTNASVLIGKGLRPLPPALALRHRDLTSQPLLLFMLALYDAQANEVQTLSDEEALNAAGLYERLLTSYAQREVRKSHSGAAEATITALVESELLRLSVAAFAMFNRSQQWISETELDADLDALSIAAPSPATPAAGFRTPLTAGQEIIGRFFFIQHARAIRDERQLHTYEFLHATFGEFLVARLTVRVLMDLAARQAAATLPLRSSVLDDGLLYSLLSFAPLTARGTVLPFVAASFRETADPDTLFELLLRTFQLATHWTESQPSTYQPIALPLVDRHALYPLNLLLLAVTINDVTAAQLFPRADDPIDEWRMWMQRWQAAVDGDSWYTLISQISATRTWKGSVRHLELRLALGDPVDITPVDPYWVHDVAPGSAGREFRGFRHEDHVMVQHTYHLRAEQFDEVFRHALEPVLHDMGAAVTHFARLDEDQCQSVAHSLVALWIASDTAASVSDLTDAYARAVHVTVHAWQKGVAIRDAQTSVMLLLRMLSRRAAELPPQQMIDWCRTIADCDQITSTHIPLLLECALVALEAIPKDGQTRRHVQDILNCCHSMGYPTALMWEPPRQRRVHTALVDLGMEDIADSLFR